MSSLGSARTLLLAALALAAVVMVGSIALLATSNGGGDSESKRGRGGQDDETADGGLGAPNPDHPKKPKPPRDPRKPGDPDAADEHGGEDLPGGDLSPDRLPRDGADAFRVTDDTLRRVLADLHWEEIRRQMEVLQAEGKTVPPDVVKELIAMFAKEDTRLDAVLALGGVKDDATGRALAALATSTTASKDERLAALAALSHSGQGAALSALEQLATAAGTDEEIARGALPAIAAIGGPEATTTLVNLEKQHANDDLGGVILVAIGKLQGGDAQLAQTLRDSEQKGDRDGIRMMAVVAQMQGDKTGPEVKQELEKIVSGAQLQSFESEEDRTFAQAVVMPAAVSAGVVEPVVRAASTPGPLRDTALSALRSARGDAAAKQILAALAKATDPVVRREMTVALGEDGSNVATPTLVKLLDDSDVNVRNAAAMALGKIRDPAATKPLLAHLAKATGERDFAIFLLNSIGQIGANEALATLDQLAASKDPFWAETDVRMFVQQAAARIRTGNPDSQLLGTTKGANGDK